MKLRIDGIGAAENVGNITAALLEMDLGARINFNLEAQLVRIAGRLTVGDATDAIERCGVKVVSVVDRSIDDAGFRSRHGDVLAL